MDDKFMLTTSSYLWPREESNFNISPWGIHGFWTFPLPKEATADESSHSVEGHQGNVQS